MQMSPTSLSPALTFELQIHIFQVNSNYPLNLHVSEVSQTMCETKQPLQKHSPKILTEFPIEVNNIKKNLLLHAPETQKSYFTPLSSTPHYSIYQHIPLI